MHDKRSSTLRQVAEGIAGYFLHSAIRSRRQGTVTDTGFDGELWVPFAA